MTMRIIEMTKDGERTVGEVNEQNISIVQSMSSIERSMQNAVDRLRSIKVKREKNDKR